MGGGGCAKIELPLDVALVRDNNIDNVKRLIAQGVEINTKDDKQRAPVRLAAWHGHRGNAGGISTPESRHPVPV